MLKRPIAIALWIIASTVCALPLVRESQASGMYSHSHKADTAIGRLNNDEIREILENHRQLFRFSSLFPDAFGDTDGTIHTPEFLTSYARAIRNECFVPPIGSSCSRKPDKTCEPLGFDCGLGEGFCKTHRITLYCERLITHFMGALTHLVTDVNADKFFMRSVAERSDCPSDIYGGDADDAQLYTDQDMDAYLGRSAKIGGADTPLVDFLPSTFLAARVPVQDNFVNEVLLASRDPKCQTGLAPPGTICADEKKPTKAPYEDGDVSSKLNQQWIAVLGKTNSRGETFEGFVCSQPRGEPEDDRNSCFPGSDEKNCDVEKDPLQPDLDGKCDPEYTTRCDTDVGCTGLFKTCETTYGHCQLLPLRRMPREDRCQWAIDLDHWYTEGGGTIDDADEIAKLIDRSWRFMRNSEKLRYRMVGNFGDRHLCVSGTDGPDCLERKVLEILGDGWESRPGMAAGTLSNFSDPRKVEEIFVEAGSARLRFMLQTPRLMPTGVDTQVECGDGRNLDLDLGAEPAETQRLTDLLFGAFINDRRVQVRTDLASCSSGGQFLVKDIRLEALGPRPTADAGPDQILECTSPSGAVAILDGTGSSDPEGDPLTFAWAAPGISFDDPTSPTSSATFPKATRTATLLVSDGQNDDSDDVDILVVDTTSPTLVCPSDLIVECSEAGGAAATNPAIAAFLAGASATDGCDAAPMLGHDGPDFFGLGETQVTFTATDTDGNVAECGAIVTVRDGTPPSLALSLDPTLLWPPNHKLRDITAKVGVSDLCDPSPTFVLTNVTSSETDQGKGGGKTSGDIAGAELGTADTSFQLRSERTGRGSGRTYTATYTAGDASGNSHEESREVQVPHSEPAQALGATPLENRDVDTTAGFCGLGFELALLLPPLMWAYDRRRGPFQ